MDDEVEEIEDDDAQSSEGDGEEQQIDIDSNEIVVENVDENGQVIHAMQQ